MGNLLAGVVFLSRFASSLAGILCETTGIRAGPVRVLLTIGCLPLAFGPCRLPAGAKGTSFHPGPGGSSMNFLGAI